MSDKCVACKTEKHALFTCPDFKSMSQDKMISTLQSNELCLNCLRPGHFSRQCPSSNRKCQGRHHTLIHNDSRQSPGTTTTTLPQVAAPLAEPIVSSNISTGSNAPNTLLMTCQVQINAPGGTPIKVRPLLDSGSTMSFVSECVVQSRLRRRNA